MIFFAGLSPDKGTQENLGYSMITGILVIIAVGFLDITYSIGRTLYLIGKKCYKRYKAWKNPA